MASVFSELPWHEGEIKMHNLLKSPPDLTNPTVPMLSTGAAYMLQIAPLLALGTVDADGNIWTTLWGGEPGFARGVQGSHMAFKADCDIDYDPVAQALLGGEEPGQGMISSLPGKRVSGLAIDLERRRRVKLYGKAAMGAVSLTEDAEGRRGQFQAVVKIEQSLGNCPKYLNSKRISPAIPKPTLALDTRVLNQEALDLIHQADLFFISSAHGSGDMDTNHRGGPAGFTRAYTNTSGESVIVWPDYSGNQLYQTLGNIASDPRAGLVFPNFDTGDVLYVSGTAEVLIGQPASKLLSRSGVAVSFTVKSARLVRQGLPFRGKPLESSPYNPRVRALASEQTNNVEETDKAIPLKVTRKTQHTADIATFSFFFTDEVPAQMPTPGQWVALDFSGDLEEGYSHMRDHDPRSLNEDFVRTFTVSSPPSSQTPQSFDITIRKVGRVTDFLFDEGRPKRRVGLRGFGGNFRIDLPPGGQAGFVAGGVGITPLLSALPGLDEGRLRVVWTLSAKDAPFVGDVMKENPRLAGITKVFFTGANTLDAQGPHSESYAQTKEVLQRLGTSIEERRLQHDDLKAAPSIDKWYVCASIGLRKVLLEWLGGKDVHYEDFSF